MHADSSRCYKNQARFVLAVKSNLVNANKPKHNLICPLSKIQLRGVSSIHVRFEVQKNNKVKMQM